MAIVDTDIIEIINTSRDGSTNIVIEFILKDADGVVKFEGSIQYSDAEEAMREVTERLNDVDSAIIVLLGAIINKADGNFRANIFDALPGKSFRITQKINQI